MASTVSPTESVPSKSITKSMYFLHIIDMYF
jgi:hypothetical protein